jgi:hypothetical protein
MSETREQNQILPIEVVNRATWRELITIAVIGIVAVLVANVILAHSGAGDIQGHNVVGRNKWQHIQSPKHPIPKLLILGDSSALYGVSSTELDSALNTCTWNYATTAAALTLEDALMLDKFISQHGPPEDVLIVHTYDLWHRGVNRLFWANYPVFWETRALFEGTGAFALADVIMIAAMRALPMVHLREIIAYYARVPWRIPVEKEYKEWSVDSLAVHGQFRVDTRKPSAVEADRISHLVSNIPNAGRPTDPISTQNRVGLDLIAEMSAVHNFPVYLANGPVFDQLSTDSSFMKVFARIDSALSSYANGHESVHYIGLLDKHPLEDMKDSVEHLVAEASDIYTRRLAQYIQNIRE